MFISIISAKHFSEDVAPAAESETPSEEESRAADQAEELALLLELQRAGS